MREGDSGSTTIKKVIRLCNANASIMIKHVCGDAIFRFNVLRRTMVARKLAYERKLRFRENKTRTAVLLGNSIIVFIHARIILICINIMLLSNNS